MIGTARHPARGDRRLLIAARDRPSSRPTRSSRRVADPADRRPTRSSSCTRSPSARRWTSRPSARGSGSRGAATRSTRRRSPIAGVGPTVRRLPRDRGVPGRPAVLRGDLSRGGPARPGRGRADLRRPRLARLPPAASPRTSCSSSITRRSRSEGRDPANGNGRAASDPIATPAIPATEPARRRRSVGRSIPHESARAHVTGQAVYLDDIPPVSQRAAGRVRRQPAGPCADRRDRRLRGRAKVEGIVAVFTAADVPGDNHFGPIFHDEEVLAARECHHIGQPIVVLAGESREALRAARAAVRIELEALPAVLTIDEAIAGGHFIGPTRRIARGDAAGRAARRPSTSSRGPSAPAARSISTWRPRRRSRSPARAGRSPSTRRRRTRARSRPSWPIVSGCARTRSSASASGWEAAFGGKESQAAHPALLAALVAAQDRPAGAHRLPARPGHAGHRQAASVPVAATGSASTRTGGSRPSTIDLYSDGGCAADLSLAVMERSMLHADNAYFIPNVAVTGTVCRTNLPSNTALRGFGGPQGIAAIENVIEEIAAYLGIDAARGAPAELLRRRRARHHALRPGGRQQHAARS